MDCISQEPNTLVNEGKFFFIQESQLINTDVIEWRNHYVVMKSWILLTILNMFPEWHNHVLGAPWCVVKESTQHYHWNIPNRKKKKSEANQASRSSYYLKK